MKYSFTLKDNNQRAYYLFTWFLFFLHVAAAVLLSIKSNGCVVKQNAFISLALYGVLGILLFIYRRHNGRYQTIIWLLAFVYGNFWFFNAGIMAVIVFATVYVVVTLVKGKRTTVFFSDEGIHLTRVFKTVIFPWAAMENVILKDNMLTIDFKTNKII